MTFLEDGGWRPGGPGADLRGFLREKRADLAEYWYKRGVRRGHRGSREAFLNEGTVPAKLVYKGRREFFKDQKRRVRVTSRIKRGTGATGWGSTIKPWTAKSPTSKSHARRRPTTRP